MRDSQWDVLIQENPTDALLEAIFLCPQAPSCLETCQLNSDLGLVYSIPLHIC